MTLRHVARTGIVLALVLGIAGCVPRGAERAEFLEVVPREREEGDALVQKYGDVIAFFDKIRFGMQRSQVVHAVGAADEEVAGTHALEAFRPSGDAIVMRWGRGSWDIYLAFERANGVLSRAILVDRDRNVGAERIFAWPVYSAPVMESIIGPGMSETQALVLLGKPSEVVRSTYSGGVEIFFVWPIAEWDRVALGVEMAEDGRVLSTRVTALRWFRAISNMSRGDKQ